MPRKTAKPKPSDEPEPSVLEKRVNAALRELAELQPEVVIHLSPVQLLAAMMRAVLEDRITSEEIDQIAKNYYYAISESSRF